MCPQHSLYLDSNVSPFQAPYLISQPTKMCKPKKELHKKVWVLTPTSRCLNLRNNTNPARSYIRNKVGAFTPTTIPGDSYVVLLWLWPFCLSGTITYLDPQSMENNGLLGYFWWPLFYILLGSRYCPKRNIGVSR